MTLGSIIGTVYCVICLVHLAVAMIVRHLACDYTDPEDMVAMFAWPVVDVLWLVSRISRNRKEPHA